MPSLPCYLSPTCEEAVISAGHPIVGTALGVGQSASDISILYFFFLVNTPDEYFRWEGIACINYCKEMSLGENDFEIQFNFIVMRRKQEGSMCV